MTYMKPFILILSAASLVACGGSDGPTTPAVVTPVGTFALASVDGRVPPATFGATQLDGPWFVRGSLAVTATGSYTLSTTDSTRQGTVSTITELGTWTQITPDTIQFVTTTPSRQSGKAVVSGDGITRVELGHTFVWSRR